MNVAHTDETELNVFGDFEPKLSSGSKRADMLFLGNIQPELQRRVRAQCTGASFVALDSMNLWIETARDELIAAIREVDCVVINDAEIRELMDEPNLARAGRQVMDLGPRIVVAKQGEYGAALFSEHGFFAIPGYPLEEVRDPTGAGDSFAGGLLGYLDGRGRDPFDDATLRQAMAYGSVMASFNVEEFGTERVQRLRPEEIAERFGDFRRMTHFEEAPETAATK
jgi:sugar/nucleoside kinase (ribokinase family)